MAKISTADFKSGLTIRLDNQIFQILEFQHVKPGKGGAFVRTKLRNIRAGTTMDRTFRAGEKVDDAFLEERKAQFLYAQGDTLHLMDTTTFDQLELPAALLGKQVGFLKEGTELTCLHYESEPIGVRLPNFMELAVRDTDPGLKGDTAKSGSKPATLESGATIQVPLFIQPGEVLKVDEAV